MLEWERRKAGEEEEVHKGGRDRIFRDTNCIWGRRIWKRDRRLKVTGARRKVFRKKAVLYGQILLVNRKDRKQELKSFGSGLAGKVIFIKGFSE